MAVLIPGKVVIAGDWHQDVEWALHVISEGGPPEGSRTPRLFLHVGDFMGWDAEGYLDTLDAALSRLNSWLWFLKGNHEDHDLLDGYLRNLDENGMGIVRSRIRLLPQGYRWEWHGRTWVALGGAVSIDKWRRHDEDGHTSTWWPQEEITRAEADAVIAAGPAGVMLAHDCPAGVVMALPFPDDPAWLPMIPAAEQHRRLLQEVCEAVSPSYLFHGHYHYGYTKTVDAGWGACEFTGLHMNGYDNNWIVLDTMTMEWSTMDWSG